MISRYLVSAASLALIACAPAAAQSSINCDLPDAHAASAHYDGTWRVTATDVKTGEDLYTVQDCSNPARLTAIDSSLIAREGGTPISVLNADGSTILWSDERGQAIASKPLNGSFMLIRHGYGHNRSEYNQYLRYDRCPVAGEEECYCTDTVSPAP